MREGNSFSGGLLMSAYAYSVVMSIWAVLLAAFVAVMVYRGNLTQHETDQLFLNDEETISPAHEENDEIVRKVNAIQPVCTGVGGAFFVMSLVVIGMIFVNLMAGATLRL
jgi:hypothetical protein